MTPRKMWVGNIRLFIRAHFTKRRTVSRLQRLLDDIENERK